MRKKFFILSILCSLIANPHSREGRTIQTKKGGLYINPEGLIYIAFLVFHYNIHYHYASKRCRVSVIERKRKEETLTKQKPYNKILPLKSKHGIVGKQAKDSSCF